MGKNNERVTTMLVIKDKESKAMKACEVKDKGSGDKEFVARIGSLIDTNGGGRKDPIPQLLHGWLRNSF